ncbi:MAG: 2-dehydro-3-deoxyphosphooctonate aldolase, partial [Gammaproteobacteria bacterium]|nr:2-dehydro-3-deoxyphosphooctonate aldolase [Gammaproteobacteria bacterium]
MNKTILMVFLCSLSLDAMALSIPTSPRAERSIANVESTLKKELSDRGLEYGAPVFVRIFKDPGVL